MSCNALIRDNANRIGSKSSFLYGVGLVVSAEQRNVALKIKFSPHKSQIKLFIL